MQSHSRTPHSKEESILFSSAPMSDADGGWPSVKFPSRYQGMKRAVDAVISSILAVVALPIVLICAFLIRMTSHGPAFYTQVRLGRFGKPFRIWKLRTMIHNCELTSGARWAMRNDPRATPVGRFLRITHLDELPQLWNVLKGDMSMVGPRPERPEFVPVLEDAIPEYRKRLLIRPGVTGVSQIYLPPDTGIASVRKKLVYDLHYIRNMGLWLDLRLMIATGLQAVGLPCRFVRRILLLPRPMLIEQPIVVEKAGVHPKLPVAETFGDLSYETRS